MASSRGGERWRSSAQSAQPKACGARERPRVPQPAQVTGRDVQLVEAVRDVRVVLEVRRILRAAVAQRPPERIGREQRSQLAGDGEQVGALETTCSLRERGEREPV